MASDEESVYATPISSQPPSVTLTPGSSPGSISSRSSSIELCTIPNMEEAIVPESVNSTEEIQAEPTEDLTDQSVIVVPGTRQEVNHVKVRYENGCHLLNDDSSFTDFSSVSSRYTGLSVSTIISGDHDSIVVVETITNGVRKLHLLDETSRRLRGRKLHVFREHIFVAQHIGRSHICQICGRQFSLRPGKQGYKCRQCSFRCHKRCHIRVSHICPNPGQTTLELHQDALEFDVY